MQFSTKPVVDTFRRPSTTISARYVARSRFKRHENKTRAGRPGVNLKHETTRNKSRENGNKLFLGVSRFARPIYLFFFPEDYSPTGPFSGRGLRVYMTTRTYISRSHPEQIFCTGRNSPSLPGSSVRRVSDGGLSVCIKKKK